MILLRKGLTFNVSTFIIQFIGVVRADTGKAPPKRGSTGRKKMNKRTIQILILVAVFMLASANAY
ncbi:hypothetical protein JY73_09470 [Neisseria meningitidis]|nr:hypothetical protein [Neisseria meningitidis]RPC94479.1 hypothetical protein JY73_09470 [Neisseria meningitidis]